MDGKFLRNESGISPGRLNTCLKNLLETALISRVMDGRHARYFPTDRYKGVIEEEKSTFKEFVRILLRKMTEEHLKPEIYDMKGIDIVIEITILGQKERIKIPQRKIPSPLTGNNSQ